MYMKKMKPQNKEIERQERNALEEERTSLFINDEEEGLDFKERE